MDIAFVNESLRAISLFSVEGIKSLFLVSGGSGAALLALFGHLATSGGVHEAKSLALSLTAFFIAALLASASFCCSYAAQSFYYYAAFSKRISRPGAAAHAAAVLAAVLAYAACLAGAYLAYRALARF